MKPCKPEFENGIAAAVQAEVAAIAQEAESGDIQAAKLLELIRDLEPHEVLDLLGRHYGEEG